jgi:hypothetical protein
VLKEEDITYNQQCDVIFKLEHLWFQTWLVTFDDKTHFVWIHEIKKNPFAISIKGHLKNQNQVQSLSNNHDNFKLRNGLFYHNELLYILNGLIQFQVL